MISRSKRQLLLIAISSIIIVSACQNNSTPKPMGYFRIAFPEKSYDTLSSLSDHRLPFTCLVPTYSTFVEVPSNDKSRWFNMNFPAYNATIHLTYYQMDTTLSTYIETSRSFAVQHIPKATAIKQKVISHPEHSVYGLYYNIQGSETASPIQFYITDSTTNFLRGALYFNNVPNNDSLSPVIEFIDKDLITITETLQWRQ